MGRFLEGLIPQLTRAVAQAEIPASERRTTRSRRRRRGTGSGGRSRTRTPRRRTASRSR